MDFSFSDEQTILRKEIIRFAQQELNQGVLERDRQQQFPRDLWLKCGQMRLQGLAVPEEYGGGGLDPLSTAIALGSAGVWLSRQRPSVFSICAHLLACVSPRMEVRQRGAKAPLPTVLCDGTLDRGQCDERAWFRIRCFCDVDQSRARWRRFSHQRREDVQFEWTGSRCGIGVCHHRCREGLPRRSHRISGGQGTARFLSRPEVRKNGTAHILDQRTVVR